MPTETTNWRTNHNKTNTPHIWNLTNDISHELEAMVKWDGCVHLWRRYLGTEENDYIHICDLEVFIDQLIALRDQTDTFREH